MNAILRALTGGEPALGGWLFAPTPQAAQLYAEAGFDWVLLDQQHGSAAGDATAGVIHLLRARGLSVAVRVEWNSPAGIMRALDAGAETIVVPMVETVDEARAAAAATRYPPAGVRSYGPVTFPHADVASANDDVLCLVMIETVAGVENAAEIAATPGVDGLFFGPIDYALAIGLEPSFGHTQVRTALQGIVAAADAGGAFVASIAADAAHAKELLGLGVRVLTIGSDRAYVRAGAQRDVRDIRSLRVASATPTAG